MKKTTSWLVCLCVGAGLLVCHQSLGQYGYGNGMGGYGMGGRRGGMGGMSQNMPSSPPKASIPNIAGDMAQKETKWLKENLTLSSDQAKSVKKLNNEYADQQQDAIKDIIGTGGGRPTPEKIKEIQDVLLMFNEEKEEKLRPIFTPEQWTLYQSKKEDMKKEIGGFRPPAPKSMKDSLSKASTQP